MIFWQDFDMIKISSDGLLRSDCGNWVYKNKMKIDALPNIWHLTILNAIKPGLSRDKMANRIFNAYFVCLIQCGCIVEAFLPIMEQRLHHFLITEKRYNKLVRPFGPEEVDGRLTVKLGIRLSQILDVVSCSKRPLRYN